MGKVMFSQVFVCSRGEEGHCLGRRGVVSVRGWGDYVCPGVSVQGEWGWASVWEGLCHGDPPPYV